VIFVFPLLELRLRAGPNRVRLLRPGGRLIYCTCSVLPAENENVVAGTDLPGVGKQGRYAVLLP
jgi:hypothetical protein